MTEQDQGTTTGYRPRLLIADDDAVVRSTLSAQLSGDFEIVGAAKDTGEAIALAEEHRPDAALLDVEMPGGGGLEAVQQLSKRFRICLIILSADESRQGVINLLNAGATAYVRKGLTGPEIATKLADSMKAKRHHPA